MCDVPVTAIERLFLNILLCCLAGLSGCGKSRGFETAPVSGKVTLDGQPITKGTVTFVPRKGKTARGSISEDGSFTLGTYSNADGAIIGDQRVVIVSHEGGMEEDTTPKYRVPRRYGSPGSSGLTFDVQSGVDNFASFELTSKDMRRKEQR